MLSLLLAVALQEPLSPDETVARLRVPDGFRVQLFAGEPDVVQPISVAIDDRGRLWVAEALNYPKWDPPGRDRIVILEDTDGDGRADKRTVFAEGLTYVTGLEVGFGGAWVVAPPQMLFLPDRDGDDRADGEPVVLLDGFGTQGGHNIVNGFTWGPDGWLYAGHGRTSISDLGKPGTPPEQRLHFDGGVWRYHPTRHVVEAFADGTTNPWGVAFDEWGQAFVSNCVNPHLFHAVQGGHFEPWRGRESSRFAYKRLDTIADHLHWKGTIAQGRDGTAEQMAAGGGHAHCGIMIYLGGAFPEAYRGQAFLSNLHGHRINMDVVRRRGSGYTAAHGPDFLVSDDRMFMGLAVHYGPAGEVYVSDWYDRGECHTRNPHQPTGRIYRVAYGNAGPARPDLARRTTEELVELQLHPNEWYVTHARRLLQERGASAEAVAALRRILEEHPEPQRRLRALWALHALGKPLPDLLDDPREHLRAWSIRLDAEDGATDHASRWAHLARTDPSPVVRLALAEACRRIPFEAAWPVLEGLATRGEDVDDPNLPLMIWYAAWPMAEKDPGRALSFVRSSRLPVLREFMARQLAATMPVRRVPPPDAPAGTVAFSSLAPRGWDVFLHDRQTGETRRLADAPRLDFNAMLTNDGRRVAFVSEREGNAEIYTVGADGSNLRRLTDDPALDDHPVWSPDGRSILFSSTRQDPREPGRAWNALYVMAADGTGVQRLSPPDAADYSPAWAPWGDTLACATGRGRAGGTDIVVMRPDGGDRQVVAKDGGWPTFVGRSVLFHSRRDGEWAIWRVNNDGSGLKRLSPKGVPCFTPRAASHAKAVAVVALRDGRRQIAILDPDKGTLADLTSGDADHWNPSISGDGRFVVYHRAVEAPKPDVEASTTPDLTALKMLRVDGAFPAFSADGRRIALVSGFRRLDVLALDGGRRTLREGPAFSVAWSKADDRIAFAAGETFGRADAAVRILSVTPEGGDEQALTEGRSNDAFPSFSPDGRRMVFRSGRGGSKNLHVREPAGVRRLTEGPWTDTMPDWSPSGDLIVFASDRDGEFDLWLVRPDGTGLRKLVGGGGRDNHPKFSPDGRWVVFASERAGYSAEEASLPSQPQPYGDLFAVRLDGAGPVRLTHTPWEEGTPAWSK